MHTVGDGGWVKILVKDWRTSSDLSPPHFHDSRVNEFDVRRAVLCSTFYSTLPHCNEKCWFRKNRISHSSVHLHRFQGCWCRILAVSYSILHACYTTLIQKRKIS